LQPFLILSRTGMTMPSREMTMRTTRSRTSNDEQDDDEDELVVGCGFEDGQGTRNRAASSRTSWRPGVLKSHLFSARRRARRG
jgi:hypothetical protein